MRRGLLTLLVLIVLGGSAYLVASRRLAPSTPSGWLCHQYALGPEEARKLDSLERDYGSRCGPYCDVMCKANAHLGTLALGSDTVTPELRAAVAETDRIRTSARIAMLEHFYAVAAQLPPDKRRDYLQKVLPLVIDSCGNR